MTDRRVAPSFEARGAADVRRNARAILLMGILLGLFGCVSNLPKAMFTATPSSGYPPFLVSFDASDSTSPNGQIVGYSWDFGDGESATGILATHTYEEKGLHTATLSVTDSLGKVGVRSMVIDSKNRPPVAAFTPSVYSTPVRQKVWFDASESYDPDGEIVEYLWSFGDGGTDSGVIVSHEYETAGGSGWRPEITLTVIDENGGQDSRMTEILVVGCDSCGG